MLIFKRWINRARINGAKMTRQDFYRINLSSFLAAGTGVYYGRLHDGCCLAGLLEVVPGDQPDLVTVSKN